VLSIELVSHSNQRTINFLAIGALPLDFFLGEFRTFFFGGGLSPKMRLDKTLGDGIGYFEIKIGADTAKFTNVRIAGFG